MYAGWSMRKHTNHKDRYTMYKASTGDCGTCSLKSRCTQAPRRGLARHLYEDALNRMQARMTPQAMRLRRCTVEHPFATIKYRIFGHPRLLMRGLSDYAERLSFDRMKSGKTIKALRIISQRSK